MHTQKLEIITGDIMLMKKVKSSFTLLLGIGVFCICLFFLISLKLVIYNLCSLRKSYSFYFLKIYCGKESIVIEKKVDFDLVICFEVS